MGDCPRTRWLAPVLAGLLWAGVADAQRRAPHVQSRRGDINVLLRGGVGNYTGALGELTAAGPSWGVTLNLQPTRVLGWELIYLGSRNQVYGDALADDPTVTRHGAAGLLKLGLPFAQKLRPYLGVGLGGSYAKVSGGQDAGYRNDYMQELPLAIGLEFNHGALTTGIRGSYHLLFDEAWAAPAVEGTPQGGFADGQLTLGIRF
jgi:opacity protein-like surface antigen